MGGVAGVVPQRSLPGRGGAVTQEMLQGWLAKLGAGVHVDTGGGSGQTFTTGVIATVTWERAVDDSHGFWSPASPTIIQIPRGLDGVYLCGGALRWAANATGRRLGYVNANGIHGLPGSTSTKVTTSNADGAGVTVADLPARRMLLAGGDQVIVEAQQSSTANLDLEANDDTHFWMTRVGDLPVDGRFQ